MFLNYQRTFRIRHYECDAHGHVNPANTLRYMQEAAYEASAAAGYDMVGYSALGHVWLIRETEIEYLKLMFYGESVIVRTWVEDFRRVRSRRAYELREANTGAIVARSWSDWVYLDTASGKPSTIPSEMVKAFMAGSTDQVSLARHRFPAAPAMPSGYHRMLKQVEWRDLDALQHVNNAVYLSYFEEAAFQSDARFNWSVDRLRDEKIAILTRKAHLEYRLPAVLGESLAIDTWISNIGPISFMRHYVCRRALDGEILCQAHLEHAWVDQGTGRPLQLAAEFKRDFASHISEESSE